MPSEETIPEIAIDSTKLIAADSFLFPSTWRNKDPYNDLAFKDVVKVYCNPIVLRYLSPPAIPEGPTPLLRAFSRIAKPITLIESSYEASGIGRAYAETRGAFYELASHDGIHVADWLRFQLEDARLTQIFWSGGNTPGHLRLAKEAIEDLDWEPTALYKALVDQPLRFADDDTLAALRHLKTHAWMGIAYAFHAFAKGRIYPRRLANGPGYLPHWLRLNSLPSTREEGVALSGTTMIECFPWGDLLYSLHREAGPILFESEERVIESLELIRSFSEAYQPSDMAQLGPEVVEDYALSALRYAGWIPAGNVGWSRDRLLGLVRRTLELPGVLAESVGAIKVPGAKFVGFLIKELNVGGWLQKRLIKLDTRDPTLRLESLSARRRDPDISKWAREYAARVSRDAG